MDKRLKLVGTAGRIPIDEFVEDSLSLAHVRFLKYVSDSSGATRGAKFLADKGHGYGFSYGEQEVTLYLGDEFRFEHSYTDTADGTWENDSFTIKVRLVEE